MRKFIFSVFLLTFAFLAFPKAGRAQGGTDVSTLSVQPTENATTVVEIRDFVTESPAVTFYTDDDRRNFKTGRQLFTEYEKYADIGKQVKRFRIRSIMHKNGTLSFNYVYILKTGHERNLVLTTADYKEAQLHKRKKVKAKDQTLIDDAYLEMRRH